MSEETVKQDGASPFTYPFQKKYLDDDKETTGREVISLKINADERKDLNELKRMFNTGQDGKVIKQALRTFKKVVLANFEASEMEYWTSNERRKPLFDNAANDEVEAKK